MGRKKRKSGGRHQRNRQKRTRRRNGESAFLFDGQDRCLGKVERSEWEWAISMGGGDVAEAAALAGIAGVPRGAQALWGQSPEHALSAYRAWQARKRKARKG